MLTSSWAPGRGGGRPGAGGVLGEEKAIRKLLKKQEDTPRSSPQLPAAERPPLPTRQGTPSLFSDDYEAGVCPGELQVQGSGGVPYKKQGRDFPVGQWLGLRTSTAGGTGSIPGQGSFACYVVRPKKQTKKNPGGLSECMIKNAGSQTSNI